MTCRDYRKRGLRRHLSYLCGYSLAEMMVAMTVMTVLLGGLASALHISGRALPDEDSPVMRTLNGSRVVNHLVDELTCALHFTERSSNSVTFIVPDRDGDSRCEQIRYAWDGSADDPGSLVRTYNENEPMTVATDVHEFALNFNRVSRVETYPGPVKFTDEILLSMFNDGYTPEEIQVEKDQWVGQYFKPSLSENAQCWKISRIEFPAKSDGAVQEYASLQIRIVDENNTPTNTVLDQVQMQESSLPNYFQWRSFTFGHCPPQPTHQGLCLVVKQSDGGPSCRVAFEYDPRGFLYKDENDAWNYYSNITMYYKLYGKIGHSSNQLSFLRRYMSEVHVACQVGSDQSNRIVTTAYPLNEPEILNTFWKVNFDQDPTLMDVNGDTIDDWSCANGLTFDSSTLVSGKWQADGFLETRPENHLQGAVTAEVRFRDKLVSGKGALFRINAGWDDTSYAPLIAELSLQESGQQKLILYYYSNGATREQLAVFEPLPSDFITLRLLINPSTDTVNVRIDDQQQGTFIYNTISAFGDDPFVSIGSETSGAEFDYVSVRVGESGQ